MRLTPYALHLTLLSRCAVERESCRAFCGATRHLAFLRARISALSLFMSLLSKNAKTGGGQKQWTTGTYQRA